MLNIGRDDLRQDFGVQQAGQIAAKQLGVKTTITSRMLDIPRSHLPWWARIWEGTSGDRVVDALGKDRGGVRALVVPNWVVKQKVIQRPAVVESIAKIKARLKELGLRLGGESVEDFLKRKNNQN